MKTKQKMRIIFAVFFLIIVVCGIVTAIKIHKSKKAENKKLYESISYSVYESVKWMISTPVSECQTLAADIQLIELLKSEPDISDAQLAKEMSEYLETVNRECEASLVFCTSDYSKKYFNENGLIKIINPENDKNDIWYPGFLETNEKYHISIDNDQVDGDVEIVFVDSRVEDENGNLLGVITLGTTLDALQNILRDYEKRYKVKVNFVDKNGVVKIDTDSVNIDKTEAWDNQYGYADNEEVFYYKASDGSDVVTRYIKELGLYLVVRDR